MHYARFLALVMLDTVKSIYIQVGEIYEGRVRVAIGPPHPDTSIYSL